MPSRRSTELAIVAIASLLGALVLTWPLAVDATGTLPAPGDSKYSAWALYWVADRTAHGLAGVWDTPIFHPYKTTLALAEPMLSIGLLHAPFVWLGANPVLLHNIAVWTSFVVAGMGGYVLGRDLTGRRAAGVVCGAVAAFVPYRVGHLLKVQVLWSCWLWWAAWSVHRYFARPSLWYAVRIAVFFILLGLSSLYFAYAGVVPLLLIVAAEAWRRRGPVRVWLVHGLVAAVLCALAYVPVARAVRSIETGGVTVASTVDVNSYSADILSLVSGQPSWLVWGSVLRRGDGESDLFPGLVVLVFAMLALLWRRTPAAAGTSTETPRPFIWVYLALVPIGLVLAFGPTPAYNGRPLGTNPLFTWLSAAVPGFAQLRTSGRFAVIAQLALSVLAAYGVAAWLARRRASSNEATATALVAGGLIFLEGLAPPTNLLDFSPYIRSGDRQTVEWLAQHPGGAVLELPLDGWGPIDYSMVYQHRTLVHHHPTVAGVSRYNPPLQGMLADPDSPLVAVDRVPEGVAFLRALGVRYVVVHPSWFRNRNLGEAMREAYTQASGRPSRSFGESTLLDLGAVAGGPPSDALPEMPTSAMRVTATSGNVERMLDGDPATRWLTGRPQNGSERIDIALQSSVLVSGVRLQIQGRSLNDYPRALTVSVSSDGAHFAEVFAGSVFPALGAALLLDPLSPAIDVRWAAAPAQFVRLQQTGRTGRRWFWSVHELRLLTPAR
jgi:hypothetical protein